MSTVHGAGLLLLPVLVAADGSGNPHADPAGAGLAALSGPLTASRRAGSRSGRHRHHTAAMVAVAGAIALVIYKLVGLAILRSAWVNLDKF